MHHGQIRSLKPSQRQQTPCIDIILYGYLREPPQSSDIGVSGGAAPYRWLIKPDPTDAEGLARKELRLTIPLKYISDKKTVATVKIHQIQQAITERVSAQTLDDYGVEVAQVDIRRLSIPPTNLASVYKKMKAERQRVIEAYTSSGRSQADIIRSRASLIASQKVSEAQGQAQAITGKADAHAANIAAKVQQLDPEFYNWLQSLETAAEILKNKAWVVLSTNQDVMGALFEQKLDRPQQSKEKTGKTE